MGNLDNQLAEEIIQPKYLEEFTEVLKLSTCDQVQHMQQHRPIHQTKE